MGLRRLLTTDAQELEALDADPEVMRHLGGVRASAGLDAVRARIEVLVRRYDEFPGFGLWVCRTLGDDAFVGWFMLRPSRLALYGEDGRLGDPVSCTELGYRLARRHWGQGYATEMGRALLDHGFEQLGLVEVSATVLRDNGASIRVLEKVGMRHLGPGRQHEIDVQVYGVARP